MNSNQVPPSLLIVDTKGRGSNTERQREGAGLAAGGMRSISVPTERAKWAIPEFPWGLHDIIHRCAPHCFAHYLYTHTHTSLARPSFCSNLTLEGCVQIIKLELPSKSVFLLDTTEAWSLRLQEHCKYRIYCKNCTWKGLSHKRSAHGKMLSCDLHLQSDHTVCIKSCLTMKITDTNHLHASWKRGRE